VASAAMARSGPRGVQMAAEPPSFWLVLRHHPVCGAKVALAGSEDSQILEVDHRPWSLGDMGGFQK
jgi:hypothetical protein